LFGASIDSSEFVLEESLEYKKTDTNRALSLLKDRCLAIPPPH
jgi:hypothetical protein